MNRTAAVAIACMASHTPWIVLTAMGLLWLNPHEFHRGTHEMLAAGHEAAGLAVDLLTNVTR